MTTRGDLVHDLAQAVRTVRAAVAETAFPLPVASAAAAQAQATALLAQIDDYLLPRLSYPQAPMLVAVGGSTGAGKSTLVNSLAQAPVSATGVLRPTTRAPVLACHPSDAAWFRDGSLLRGLGGSAGPAGLSTAAAGLTSAGPTSSTAIRLGAARLDRRPAPDQPQLISAPALAAGLALLDTPDIDSALPANRALAQRLLAAADMWLFVTTANRYADALPWQMLRTARQRGTVVALVLGRVPPPAIDEVAGLLTTLLREQRLTDVPVFVLPETQVQRPGLLPETITEPLRGWLNRLVGDAPSRASVIRFTLDGALAALPAELAALATAADEQVALAETLAEQVGLAYGVARGTIERGLRASEFGSPDPGEPARHRRSAAETGLVELVLSTATDAAEQTDQGWRSHPVGAALLGTDVIEPHPELGQQVRRIAREQPTEQWPTQLNELLDGEATRWLGRLAGAPLDGSPAPRLRAAATRLERVRLAARLTDVHAPTAVGETGANEAVTMEGRQ